MRAAFERAKFWVREDEAYNGYNPTVSTYVEEAARYGNVEFLKWLIETNGTLKKSLLTEDLCMIASENGQLHALQWLRSQDPPCPWDEDTCSNAARNGHLNVLQWVRSQVPQCPWDEYTCSKAARNGQMKVLKWYKPHHCYL